MSAIAARPDDFEELFSALEELLKRIADTDDPEIRRKRAQVREEMLAVQSNPAPLPLTPAFSNTRSSDDIEGWGQQAWAALAGAAVALSVFRHSG